MYADASTKDVATLDVTDDLNMPVTKENERESMMSLEAQTRYPFTRKKKEVKEFVVEFADIMSGANQLIVPERVP